MSNYYHNNSHRQRQQQQDQYGRGQGSQYYQQQPYEYPQDRQQQQQHRQAQGRYGNEQSNNVEYYRPVTTQQQQQQGHPHPSMDLPPLPPGWVEAKDPSTGRTYYANPQTQETRWERPSLPKPLPPPLPPRLNLPQPPLQYGQHQNNSVVNRDPQNQDYNAFHHRQESTAPMVAVAATTITATAMPDENNIVTRSREMLVDDHPSSNRFSTSVTDENLELYSLSGGQIADLFKLQTRCWQAHVDETKKDTTKNSTKDVDKDEEQNKEDEDDDNENIPRHLSPYTPIHPYLLPSSSMEISRLVEKVEPGRIDVRIHSLKQELVKYGYTTTL